MKVFSKLIPVLAITAVFAFAAPVLADSPGQLTRGPQVYKVKNLTQKTSYANSASAACGDELQYSVMLHNAAYGGLTNIVVSANLAGGTVTATPAEGADAGTSGSVTVNVAAGGSLAYENGTTTLYNENGSVIKTLPDTITSGGVNIGDMRGSTTEFVNFRAKVNCQTPTPTPTPTPAPTTAPTVLPNTGAGEVVGLFAGASAIGAATHMVVSRRNRR